MTKLVLDLNLGIPFNQLEDELVCAVVLSLFCDARGIEADGSPGRGWWGDGLAENDRWGSRLWELQRSKEIHETLRLAEDYARTALTWLTQDGVARRVSITAYTPRPTVLGLQVKIDDTTLNLEVRHALR